MKKTSKKALPIAMEFEGIPVEVFHRRVKYARVEFKTNKLHVIVSPWVSPMEVLERNRTSILKKFHKHKNAVEEARKTPMVDWTEDEFIAIIQRYVEQYSRKLKVKTTEVKLRKMRRRWGSCRRDGMITLNAYLQFVPEHLIAYIIFHELSHLLVRSHNMKFKSIIVSEFPNYRLMDKELLIYGIKLLS
ncbi:MAG: M48 family metallopeptidase [Candidatus Omnitrophota bacterium]